MVKEIKYTGFTASPSDYECPDGDLAAVLNVVPEEGSLSPVLPPAKLFQITDGGNVRFVHETAYIRNFIILHPDNTITWRTQDDPDQYSHGTLSHDFSDRTIHQINAIGNTLIVLADDGMHYFFWKGYRNGTEQEGDDPKEYLYLGPHMPELTISFGLQGSRSTYTMNDIGSLDVALFHSEGGRDDTTSREPSTRTEIQRGEQSEEEASETRSSGGDRWIVTPSKDRRGEVLNTQDIPRLREHILAGVNSIIAQESEMGKFIFPFFIRYAYRLHDGSLVMHSAPILMIPCTGIPVKCTFQQYKFDDSGLSISDMLAQCISHDIDYMANAGQLSALSNWSDIIKSVDIFVSRQIYTMREIPERLQSVTFRKINNTDDGGFGFFKNANEQDGQYKRQLTNSLFQTQGSLEQDLYAFELYDRLEANLRSEIESCQLFYLLQSIDLQELKTVRTQLLVRSGVPGSFHSEEQDPNIDLRNVVSREVMTDDYESHDLLIPRHSNTYNARLNLTDIAKKLFLGYDSASQFPFTNGSPTTTVRIYYFIKQDNKDITVCSESSSLLSMDGPLTYIFYPNIHAYKAIIAYKSADGISTIYREVPLSQHPTLNGAYFFGGLSYSLQDDTDKSSSNPGTSADRTIQLQNKIYTSEVNNAYYFPFSGISTVGSRRVFALSSAAKALSQGQFGQHPLYAFSDEGVWALEVNKDGTLVPAQPFTRDVCINTESITQLDSSVLFATDRGIMLISGSNSICISDNLDYSQTFNISSLPNSDKLLSLAGFKQSDLSYVAFRDYVKGCRMLYSYNLQRIIVFNRNYPYAYVYSLRSKNWGMIPSSIDSTIPSYPEAIAQLADGSIVDYSATAEGSITGIKGVFITRTIKLDAPDQLKTVDTIIQRGNFMRGHVKSVVYGSRDLIHWFIVWTSADHYLRGFRGTPYKYFRLMLLCDLDPDESIYGCSINYTPRFTNRLR